MSKQEVFDAARRLVQQAVDVAQEAGIDPAAVLGPHCPGGGGDAATGEAGAAGARDGLWCGAPWVVDDAVTGLFEMPEPDDDPGQQPEFRVTASTAELVGRDFERYEPSLERMIEDWQEAKALHMQEKKAGGEKRV